ncbi:MAG: cupin-like domain-containing protein [Pseudomonadota bacterium]
MSLLTLDTAKAKTNLHQHPFQLDHTLSDHQLFTLERLVELASKMPRDKIEYNSGKVAINQDPDSTPQVNLEPAQVIEEIETCGAWLVIKNVESESAYQALLAEFIGELAGASGLDAELFEDLQGFIFISSAGSTTPFHIDAEENILVQISGDKKVHVFENEDRSLVSEGEMEISPDGHRNMHYQPSHEERAAVFNLKEGDAVHIPYMQPHWVGTGERYCISMAMTWKTPEVRRLNKIRFMNGTLRRYGWVQNPPGHSALADGAKVLMHDLVRAVLDPIRRSEKARRWLRGLIYGRKANYYYEAGNNA